jgi:two-component system, cell cycle response regulator CpdR
VSNRKKIMVVDDEYDIVHVVRRYLEKWGFTVDTFTDPLYALERFKKSPDTYSLALLDIRMPEISGIALAAMMQKVRPSLKIVIMTAYEIVAEDLATNLPTITRDDVIQKPFKLMQICTAIKKQLQTA